MAQDLADNIMHESHESKGLTLLSNEWNSHTDLETKV